MLIQDKYMKIKDFKTFESISKLNKLDEDIRWYKKGKFHLEPTPDQPVLYTSFIKERQFIDFLEKRGALKEFVEYAFDHFKKNFYDYWGRNIILNSLSWDVTDSGELYWDRINDEWKKYYDDNIRVDDDDEDDLDEAIRWYKNGKLILDPNSPPISEYDDFITDDNFRQFLIDNKAYDEYIECCYMKAKRDFANYFGPNVIDSTLAWNDTYSGAKLWFILHNKWYLIYRKLNKIK
jgi:hypothetical protein